MRINTQFKKTSTDYTKPEILTKILVLLLVDGDKNIFTIYVAAPYDEWDYWLFIGKNNSI